MVVYTQIGKSGVHVDWHPAVGLHRRPAKSVFASAWTLPRLQLVRPANTRADYMRAYLILTLRRQWRRLSIAARRLRRLASPDGIAVGLIQSRLRETPANCRPVANQLTELSRRNRRFATDCTCCRACRTNQAIDCAVPRDGRR